LTIQIVEAVYDGALLRPAKELAFEPNTRVRLTAEVLKLTNTQCTSVLNAAISLDLRGPANWSANLDNYLYRNGNQQRE
jgi:hypothetical protein